LGNTYQFRFHSLKQQTSSALNLLELFIIFGLSILGASLARVLKSAPSVYLKLLIAFTGGFLLSVCLVHLLPEVYKSGNPDVAIYILAGFIIQILLDQMSAGVEHGHIHVEAGQKWKPLIIITGLFIHSFLEGIPLGGHSHEHSHDSHDLFLAIGLHKLPEGIALGFLLIELNRKLWINIMIIGLFAFMTPLGSFFTSTLPTDILLIWSPLLLALVIGLFLHLSTTILFEAGNIEHKVSIRRIIAILLGIGAAYFIN